MTIFRAICIALSTYSVFPIFQFEWDEKSLRYSLAALPAVGALIGAVMLGIYSLLSYLGAGNIFCAALLCSIPVILSGGIHMDGFLDTADALSSHLEPSRALEILKDSRCGAFAMIYGIVYFVVLIGVFSETLLIGSIYPVFFCYCLSRALGAMSALLTKGARKSGMLFAFTKDADRRIAVSVLAVALLL